MISAPRESPTVTDTIISLQNAFRHSEFFRQVNIFAEPGNQQVSTAEHLDRSLFIRPNRIAGKMMPISPEGRMGNFGNWIQAGRDLLAKYPQHDTFLICEDDIAITPKIRSFIESRLWPASNCGVISLYCPAMSQYGTRPGLNRTVVLYQDPLTSRGNLVGALALLFPRKALHDLVYNYDAITAWKGSHSQARDPRTQPWERKAVDTWIGRTLVKMGYSIWHFYPSLVNHVGEVSSLGHGKSRVRSARKWAGLNPDLEKMFGKPGKVYVDVRPNPV